jgi:hypothetical protein
VDVSVVVDGGAQERFGSRRLRTAVWRLTRELQADSTWATTVSLPEGTKGLSAEEAAGAPVTSRLTASGGRRLLNADGVELSATQPVPTWPKSVLGGGPSYAGARAGLSNKSAAPLRAGSPEVLVVRTSRATQALAGFHAIPGVRKTVRGGGRATFLADVKGTALEIDVDTATGRVQEVRTSDGRTTTKATHSYTQPDPSTSVLSRSEYTRVDMAGRPVGARVTVTYTNLQTFQTSSSGS